jgi:hypothetical protein
MKKISSLLVLICAICVICGSVWAQAPTTVQQSASRFDAATFLQGPPAAATLCATVNSTAAAGTVTITPQAGQYVYITGVYIDITADVTGVSQVATLSTTNLTGSPIWSLATIVPTAGANGTMRQISETFPTALRSSVPGVAVTFVPSAQTNHAIFCTRVAGYFGP